MSELRQIHNLALIGFMGTGKSSVGRWVARRLQFAFVDTDARIEEQFGCSITEMFQRFGEPWFRKQERRVVAELAQCRRTVIATGGGLVANGASLVLLKQHSLIVCLWASPERIWERVRRQSYRPLLQTADPQARIRQLLSERAPYYRQADVLIHSELRSVSQVGQQIIQHFKLHQAAAAVAHEDAPL